MKVSRLNESNEAQSIAHGAVAETSISGSVAARVLLDLARGVDQLNNRAHVSDEEVHLLKAIKKVANTLNDSKR